MIHIYLFGPHDFISSLLVMSDAGMYVSPVGVSMEDEDPALYQTLLDEVVKSGEISVILTPRFGDRFSTIALSMPKPEHVHVVSGVNVEMLCGIRELSPAITSQIVRCDGLDEEADVSLERSSPADAKETEPSRTAQAAHEQADELAREDYESLTLPERGGGLLEAPDRDKRNSSSKQSGYQITASSVSAKQQNESSLHVEWSVVMLCELLSARGQDGVCFLNSLLRAEDDESNIDLSVLDTEHSVLSGDLRAQISSNLS